MSPVIEDKAAEWSSLHETRGWALPREQELGVEVGSARFLPRTLQAGSQNLSSPSSHTSPAPSPSQLSVYPLAGFHSRGRQHRGNRQSRSKCPARPYPAEVGQSVQCFAASAELLLCYTAISDPWDPLGMPRTAGRAPCPVSDVKLSL